MKIVFDYIGLVFLLLILAISAWNAFSLGSIKKDLKNSDKYSKEYIDIKYKLQLITMIGSIIVFIIVFYGYNSKNLIEETINKIVDEKMPKKELEMNDRFDSTLNSYILRIKSTEEKIRKIENKEIINAEIYIVKNQKIFSEKYRSNGKKIYYKDLKTITGKFLPKFKTEPVINIIPTNGMEYEIINRSRDFFELRIISNTYETSSFDIWFAK